MPKFLVKVKHTENATCDLDTPIATGSTKTVYPGKYADGTDCVYKMWTGRVSISSEPFKSVMKTTSRAHDIIHRFNFDCMSTMAIHILQPAIWRNETTRERMLIEPFLPDLVTVTSETVWVSVEGAIWSEMLQALSHFSYHTSSGSVVLCDFKGGVCSRGFTICDPVIHSELKEYGVGDLGVKGFASFFNQHTCNRFCNKKWIGISKAEKKRERSVDVAPKAKAVRVVNDADAIFEQFACLVIEKEEDAVTEIGAKIEVKDADVAKNESVDVKFVEVKLDEIPEGVVTREKTIANSAE